MNNIYTMSLSDNEKERLGKLLRDLDVVEQKIPERCRDLVSDIYKAYGHTITDECDEQDFPPIPVDNPYKIDPLLRAQWDTKQATFSGRVKKVSKKLDDEVKKPWQTNSSKEKLSRVNHELKRHRDKVSKKLDDEVKKPWQTNSSKEKLSRVNHELKRHRDKGLAQLDTPTPEEMKEIIKECKQEGDNSCKVERNRIEDSIKEAKKALPNVRFRKPIHEIIPQTNDAVASGKNEIFKDEITVVDLEASKEDNDSNDARESILKEELDVEGTKNEMSDNILGDISKKSNLSDIDNYTTSDSESECG